MCAHVCDWHSYIALVGGCGGGVVCVSDGDVLDRQVWNILRNNIFPRPSPLATAPAASATALVLFIGFFSPSINRSPSPSFPPPPPSSPPPHPLPLLPSLLCPIPHFYSFLFSSNTCLSSCSYPYSSSSSSSSPFTHSSTPLHSPPLLLPQTLPLPSAPPLFLLLPVLILCQRSSSSAVGCLRSVDWEKKSKASSSLPQPLNPHQMLIEFLGRLIAIHGSSIGHLCSARL